MDAAPRIGLALGGGGVRGLAHVPMLEAMDDLGLRPTAIAGTSMGAILGALYASGIPAAAIRERIDKHLILSNDTWRDVMAKRNELFRWVTALTPRFHRGGLVSAKGILEYLAGEIQVTTFEALRIPLLVVAADYWTAEEVVLEAGDLLQAIQATMAVPGVFAPVEAEGRVLVDGGVTNVVPYDHLVGRCDLVVAIDVNRTPDPQRKTTPLPLDAVLGAFDIMQTAALVERMKRRPPDLYFKPRVTDVRMLDFAKAEQVLDQAEAQVGEFREQLQRSVEANLQRRP